MNGYPSTQPQGAIEIRTSVSLSLSVSLSVSRSSEKSLSSILQSLKFIDLTMFVQQNGPSDPEITDLTMFVQ